MTKSRRNVGNPKKRDTARLIVFAITGLVLIGAIGFFLWQNILNKPEVYKKPPNWVTYIDADIPFKFDYPNSWAIDKEKNETKNPPKYTVKTSKTIILTASKKEDNSQTMRLSYNTGSPALEGASTPCSSERPLTNCKWVANSLTAGWLFVEYDEKRGAIWGGRLDDLSRISIHSYTDHSTFETITRSIRK